MAIRKMKPQETRVVKKEKVDYETYHSPQLTPAREIIFFLHVSVFSLLTVLTSFILLSLNLPEIIALPIAIFLSLAISNAFKNKLTKKS